MVACYCFEKNNDNWEQCADLIFVLKTYFLRQPFLFFKKLVMWEEWIMNRFITWSFSALASISRWLRFYYIVVSFWGTLLMLILYKIQKGISHLHLNIFQICFLHKIFSSFVHNGLFVLFCFLLSSCEKLRWNFKMTKSILF